MKTAQVLAMFVLFAACATTPKNEVTFVRSERGYQHFILGSNRPEEKERLQIDEAIAANIDQDLSKLSYADRTVVNEIIGAIQQGKADEYVATDYARRIINPEASAFWSEVVRVASINQTFPSCAEREMQLTSNMFMHREIKPGSDVRATCDSYLNNKTKEHPELWRVGNGMLRSCETKVAPLSTELELTAKAQAYLEGKQLGAYRCL